MEEDKAAAYYDELTRKGDGAARFKQGLGFSASDSVPPNPKSSASFFSNFVPASGPERAAEIQKQVQLESIQKKLSSHGASNPRIRDDDHRRRYDRGREETERSASKGDCRRYDRGGESSNRRSSSRDWKRRRSRSPSPTNCVRTSHRDDKNERGRNSSRHERLKTDKGGTDPSLLIDGYSKMTPAERVKAKMNLQLSLTAAKDKARGVNDRWERFDFNKDAPLDDDDDELEVAEDDASLVKDIGRSFRYSAIEAKHEEELKAAHDRAMFGGASFVSETKEEDSRPAVEVVEPEEMGTKGVARDLIINEKVVTMQRGSWRDRTRRH